MHAMARSNCLLLVVLLFLTPGQCGLNFSTPPLVIPIKNNTFSDGVGINRGIPLSLGTPGQPEGMRITFTLNNTRLRNSADCLLLANASAIVACKGASSSIFSPDSSNTWLPAIEGDWNVSSVDIRPSGNDTTVIQGYDVAESSYMPKILNFPFEVWSDATAPNKSALAFGEDSSFLQKLEDLSAIPSRVIGLFFGSRSETQGIDGETVIGGYNAAKIQKGASLTDFELGDTYTLGVPCPLQVLIKDVVLGNDQGTFPIISDTGGAIPACIDPLQAQFTFTSAMYATWENLTHHTFNAPGDGSPGYTTQTYPLSAESLIGNLTITLSNGYTTFIPHYELLSHERGSDSQGKYAITNSSRLMAAVGTGLTDYGVDIPLLGGVFLSQNYLVVDYARQKFSLAPAIVTASSGPADIRTVLSPNNSTLTPSTKSKSKTNVGAIVGGVIGGLMFLAIAAIGGILYWRRRRNDPATLIVEHPPKNQSPQSVWAPQVQTSSDRVVSYESSPKTLQASPALSSTQIFSKTTTAQTVQSVENKASQSSERGGMGSPGAVGAPLSPPAQTRSPTQHKSRLRRTSSH